MTLTVDTLPGIEAQTGTAPPAEPMLRERSVVFAFLTPADAKAVSGHTLRSCVAAAIHDSIAPEGLRNLFMGITHAEIGPFIAKGRDENVRDFLSVESAEWLMMIDSDMIFDDIAVHQLLAVAHPQERPVVGGLCFSGTAGNMNPTIYRFSPTDKGRHIRIINNYPRDILCRVDATGAAFLLVHRSVFEALGEDGWFQTPMPDGKGLPMGEDIGFCARLWDLGIPVHVNTAVKVGHHKTVTLTEQLYDEGVAASCPANADQVA